MAAADNFFLINQFSSRQLLSSIAARYCVSYDDDDRRKASAS